AFSTGSTASASTKPGRPGPTIGGGSCRAVPPTPRSTASNSNSARRSPIPRRRESSCTPRTTSETATRPMAPWCRVGRRSCWANLTPTSTFGLSVAGIVSNGTVSFRPPETGLVYLGAAPTNLRVDGAFGDWRGRPYGQDILGDVTNRTGAPEYDANVDLVATAVDLGTNFTGYVRVDGRVLGGQDIPTTRSRTYPVAVDTDLDTGPD